MKDFRSVTAGGVIGTIGVRTVMVGKPDFLRSEKIIGLEQLEESAVKLQDDGKTAIFVAIDGKSQQEFSLLPTPSKTAQGRLFEGFTTSD